MNNRLLLFNHLLMNKHRRAIEAFLSQQPLTRSNVPVNNHTKPKKKKVKPSQTRVCERCRKEQQLIEFGSVQV